MRCERCKNRIRLFSGDICCYCGNPLIGQQMRLIGFWIFAFAGFIIAYLSNAGFIRSTIVCIVCGLIGFIIVYGPSKKADKDIEREQNEK